MNLLTIDVDNAALLAALDQLGDAAEEYVDAAAKVTADLIAGEARARVQRRTGKTAAAITVAAASKPLGGYRVFTGPVSGRPENLPSWLNYGTKHMTGSHFLTNSARLEESSHERRIAAAVQLCIDERGLGD